MGNNAAYSAFEQITVGLYDLGKLDKKSMAVVMEIGRDCDIDSGGYEGLRSKRDKLDCEEIVIKIFGGKVPKRARLDDDADIERYWEQKSSEFRKITRRFDWG